MTEPNSSIADAQLERQVPLRLTIPSSVCIVGVGGVGSWIAMFLALAGVRNLWLWDFDSLSESNLNRLPLGPTYLNENKAWAMRHMLSSLVPRCNVMAMPQAWTMDDAIVMTPLSQWVVAATDTWASRRAIYEWTRTVNEGRDLDNNGLSITGVNYIEASAEGEFGGCTGEPARFTTPEESDPGYASVPVHVGPCVMAASLVCYHILHHANLGPHNIRVGWDGAFTVSINDNRI